MSTAKNSVFEFRNALENWRCDPSPENTRAVLFTGGLVSGVLLALDASVERAAAPAMAPSCTTCGAVMVYGFSHGTPITKCMGCGLCWTVVQLSGAADAG